MSNTNKIKYIAGLVFTSALLFLFINFYCIFPSFTGLVLESTEKEAVLVAKMLSSMVLPDRKEIRSIPAELDGALLTHKNDFNFEKLKIFSIDGETIYSTDPADIGVFNKNEYFVEKVARGEIYSKEIKKGGRTLEGLKVETDLLETYVPVMDGERFLGAFEIYYDITSRNNAINSLAIRYSILSLFLIFGFMILAILKIVKREKEETLFRPGILSKVYESPVYILLIIMSSIFIIELLVMRIIEFTPDLSPFVRSIADALLLVMLASPFLYLFLLRPLLRYISERNMAEAELKEAHELLEKKVKDRTIQLSDTIMKLEEEVVTRRNAEERLELFRRLIDHSTDCIYVINPETGSFYDVNEALCRSLGYKYEQLILMNVREIEAAISEDFSWGNHVAELKEKDSLLVKGMHKRKDGTTYPVEVNLSYVKNEDRDYIVAVARDISGRI